MASKDAIQCPNCEAEGQGDAVLAGNQRWCPTPQAECPVVSFWEVDDADE